MTSSSSQEFDTFIPVYDAVPEKWEDARGFFVEHLKKVSNAVNARQVGFFIDQEVISGKQFIPTAAMSGSNSSTSEQYRTVLRKVINFGALPNTGLKQVSHGITFDANFTLIHLYACATDPTNFTAFEIDHAEPAPGYVWMFMDATNVNIITGSNRTSYTRCFVIIEYMQEI